MKLGANAKCCLRSESAATATDVLGLAKLLELTIIIESNQYSVERDSPRMLPLTKVCHLSHQSKDASHKSVAPVDEENASWITFFPCFYISIRKG